MTPVRVLLVDDHQLLRITLAERLDREPDVCVVGTAGNAEEAVQAALRLRPQIILIDIEMPGASCFDAVRRIAKVQPRTKFIFLSAFAHDHYIEEALSVGAMGYLTKGEAPESIVEAVMAVAENRSRFSKDVLDRIVVDGSGASRLKGTTRVSLLTDREHEVLRYIAQGYAKKDIARLLHVSVNTVDKHTSNLMNKLNIHDRVELARFAIREGISTP